MTTQVNIITDEETLNGLHRLSDARKLAVKVDTRALHRLLIDYGVMLNALEGSSSFKVNKPAPVQKRERRTLR